MHNCFVYCLILTWQLIQAHKIHIHTHLSMFHTCIYEHKYILICNMRALACNLLLLHVNRFTAEKAHLYFIIKFHACNFIKFIYTSIYIYRQRCKHKYFVVSIEKRFDESACTQLLILNHHYITCMYHL